MTTDHAHVFMTLVYVLLIIGKHKYIETGSLCNASRHCQYVIMMH